MITFTDKRLYAQGTGEAILTDKSTGNIRYFSNKFQSGNVEVTVNNNEIRAGAGNAIAAMIPTDSNMTVTFESADFNLGVKGAQVGSTVRYGAPAMTCQTVTAEGASLAIDVTAGAPVAQLGMETIQCYVQEVGSRAPVSVTGTAYAINPDTGVVSDFVAESGKEYKVWYFKKRMNAELATVSSRIDPAVYHFMATINVYANETGSAKDNSTKAGTLYIIVPSMKMQAAAGMNGDQTANDTTSWSGQAISYDEDVVNGACDDCGESGGSVLAYYLYVPCDPYANVTGVVVPGGTVEVTASTSKQIAAQFILPDGSVSVPESYSDGWTFAKTSESTLPSGTVLSDTGLVAAGATTGDFDVDFTFDDGKNSFTGSVQVSVVSAG